MEKKKVVDNVRFYRESLEELADQATRLAGSLDEYGGPLSKSDKQLVRLAIMPSWSSSWPQSWSQSW